MRFRRALDRGNTTKALSAASELGFVGLAEALELTLLLADKEPEKYNRAAAAGTSPARQSGRTRAPRCDPGNRLAAVALAELLCRRSCERIAEALVRWSRAA